MLYYDRIDGIEGIDINQTSASKERNICHCCLKISFRTYNLMMNSITRCLNVVAILTNNKLFVNKTIYSTYTCKYV